MTTPHKLSHCCGAEIEMPIDALLWMPRMTCSKCHKPCHAQEGGKEELTHGAIGEGVRVPFGGAFARDKRSFAWQEFMKGVKEGKKVVYLTQYGRILSPAALEAELAAAREEGRKEKSN